MSKSRGNFIKNITASFTVVTICGVAYGMSANSYKKMIIQNSIPAYVGLEAVPENMYYVDKMIVYYIVTQSTVS